MQIHQMVKEFISKNKNKIELTQWTIINAIASLVYSEYIQRFKQKQSPVKKIMIPSIKYVIELLKHDGQFMKMLSYDLIESIRKDPLFCKFNNAPELVIFNDENVEILKTIFDLYMIPNIEKRIPETIMIKFGIGDDKQQIFIEDNTIDLFERKPINENQFKFIVEEAVLQLLFSLPTMEKNVIFPENNRNIEITNNEILVINNENAVCPIHFNYSIFNNTEVIDLLCFVTSTSFKVTNDGYSINTNPFNEVAIITLKEIK